MNRMIPTLFVGLFLATAWPSGVSSPLQPVTEPTVLEEAHRLYGTTNLRVYAAQEPAFSSVFPRYALFSVVELTRYPAERHYMVYDGSIHRGYDATESFHLLLPGSSVQTPENAVRYAKAFAAVANPEILPARVVVGASDSAALGHPVADPGATATISGFDVTLDTWSATNGLVLGWKVSIAVERIASGQWTVNALLGGEYVPDWTAVAHEVGHRITNAYAGGYSFSGRHSAAGDRILLTPHFVLDSPEAFLVRETGQNFDGSTWAVSAGPETGGLASLPGTLVTAGTAAYSGLSGGGTGWGCTGANPSYNWGFKSRDPNCWLEIRIFTATGLLCGACLLHGDSTILYVNERIVEVVRQDLRWWADPASYGAADVAELVLRHLLLVVLTSEGPDRAPENLVPSLGFQTSDGALVPTHFALRAVLDPGYARFGQAVAVLPGFVGMAPALDGTSAVTVRFAGEVPTLPTHLLPAPWNLVPVGDVTSDAGPAIEIDPGVHQPPSGPDSGAVRPGHLIRIGIAQCSANWIWEREDSTETYIGTAGHCVAPLPGPGECRNLNVRGCLGYATDMFPGLFVNGTWSTVEKPGYERFPAGGWVVACARECDLRPGRTPEWRTLGQVVYGNLGPIGEDFALIQVSPAFFAGGGRVDPQFPTGGAKAEGCAAYAWGFPRLLVVSGYGAGPGGNPATRERLGLQAGPCWRTNGVGTLTALPIVYGDSGGPIATTINVNGKWIAHSALGLVSSYDYQNPIVGATSVEDAARLVAEDLGWTIRVKLPPT